MKISVVKNNFSVDTESVKKAVEKVFRDHKLSANTEASVIIVEHKKIVDLAVSYMKETPEEAKDHPVLSFPTSELEGPFVFPPDKLNHIGEIIISYEKSKEIAKQKNISIDEAIYELAEHGALHLVGVHHD